MVMNPLCLVINHSVPYVIKADVALSCKGGKFYKVMEGFVILKKNPDYVST